MLDFKCEKLKVCIYDDRRELGNAAAEDISNKISELLKEKESINVVFAAAPSQNEVLAALADDKRIEWNKINAYHMDEYIGLSSDAPQLFGKFLRDRLFGKVALKSVNYINAEASDPNAEANRYGEMLRNIHIDVVVMGIGENGHIAFNDPPVADFKDKKAAKVVLLDDVCRQQQVHDGCFERMSDVPTHAVTLTVPTLMSASHLFCVVPSVTKAAAVKRMLYGEISETCPASILRTHEDAVLYLDKQSSAEI